METILQTIYSYTIGIVLNFAENLIGDINGNGLNDYQIKLGFGNVEWINIGLYDLSAIIGSFLIGGIFLILVWKVFKFFSKLVNRAFGSRKW